MQPRPTARNKCAGHVSTDGTRLDLSMMRIKKIPACASKYPGLKEIDLHRNYIHVIENLDRLKNLVKIDLSRNGIGKIEGLDGLPLETLDVSYNGIKKIEGLALPSLRSLDLRSNRIAKMEGLDNLPGLISLNLSLNKEIRRIEGLNRNPSLEKLGLAFTGIPKEECESFAASRPKITVDCAYTR